VEHPNHLQVSGIMISQSLFASLCLVAFALVWRVSDASQAPSSHDNDVDEIKAITVWGLGSMGTAVVQCLARHHNVTNSASSKVTIHAWNRGTSKRQAVSQWATVHDTAAAALAASSVTLVLIDDWKGVVQLLNDVVRELELGITANASSSTSSLPKTVVLFSTYTPTDIAKLQAQLAAFNVQLVGGAIVGVPQTICSPKALILTSSSGGKSDGSSMDGEQDDIVSQWLQPVGRVVSFPSNNVGWAPLANMALILVITFGIAGHELAHVMIQEYIASVSAAVSDHHDNVDNHAVAALRFVQQYSRLATEIGPEYTKMLLPLASHAIAQRDYGSRPYAPVGVFRRVLQMHLAFLHELGIADTTFLTSYVQSLQRVTNPKHGPAAWVEYVTSNRTSTIAPTTDAVINENDPNLAKHDQEEPEL
jgi:pyrroline-5-carboxylate reductase